MSEHILLHHGAVTIDALRPGDIGVTPIQRPSWNFEDADDNGWSYYEAFTVDSGFDEVLMISNTNNSEQIVITLPDGDTYSYDRDESDQYVEDFINAAGERDAMMTQDEWDALFDVDPSEHGSQGPQMLYWYPLPAVEDSPVQAALSIRDLPVCVVEVGGSWGLALSGGGMDLSWEIVEAYTRLGYLPPAHFADLPIDAGRTSLNDAYLVLACRRSLTVALERAQRSLELLDEKIASGSLPR